MNLACWQVRSCYRSFGCYSGATAAYQSYKTEGKVNWRQVGKAAVGGAAAAVSVGIAVATGGTALGVGVMAAGAIAGTRTALHGGNAADIASSMGKASAGAAVGGKALSAASATVKFVAGIAGTAAGTAATVKTTQTAAKTIRDKSATTQEKAAAVFDAALSAAGTIGSAALAVKSFPAVKQEIGYYMAKYQCKAQILHQYNLHKMHQLLRDPIGVNRKLRRQPIIRTMSAEIVLEWRRC